MCLYNEPKAVEKFLKLVKRKQRKFVWAYKYVAVQCRYWDGHKEEYVACEPRVIAPFRTSYIYKVGENKSNSRAKAPCTKVKDINKGIHVCTTIEKAKRVAGQCGAIIVKVKCYIDDFLGADGKREMVFKKVYLSEKEYKRALAK